MTLHYKKAMGKITMSAEAAENIQAHMQEDVWENMRKSTVQNIQENNEGYHQEKTVGSYQERTRESYQERTQGSIQERTRGRHQESIRASGRIWQSRFFPRRMTGIAAVLCLALVLLSAGAASAYGHFFHEIPEDVAGALQSVKLTDTSQDITMAVQYASVENGTLAAYVTLEDSSGLNRLAQGTDFHNSYTINKPEDADEVFYQYRSLGYDEDSHTYGFLVEITPSNGSGDALYFRDQQYTLSVGQILLGQKEIHPVYSPDWSTLPKEPATCMRSCSVWGDVNHYSRQIKAKDGAVEVLAPGSWEIPVAEGFTITAAGFLDTGFHIQLCHDTGAACTDFGTMSKGSVVGNSCYDFGKLDLIASDGSKIGNAGYSIGEGSVCSVGFMDENNRRYTEYIYDITPKDLDGASLAGEFGFGGTVLEGDWQVTFSLGEVENVGEDSAL